MAKERNPLSVKLEKETHQRLIEASERTGIRKNTLAQMAIEAAIEAIEQNDYHIVLPIRFDVKKIAAPKGDTEITYPAGRSEAVIIEDRDQPKKQKGKK